MGDFDHSKSAQLIPPSTTQEGHRLLTQVLQTTPSNERRHLFSNMELGQLTKRHAPGPMGKRGRVLVRPDKTFNWSLLSFRIKNHRRGVVPNKVKVRRFSSQHSFYSAFALVLTKFLQFLDCRVISVFVWQRGTKTTYDQIQVSGHQTYSIHQNDWQISAQRHNLRFSSIHPSGMSIL